jgi:hypothetical protein
VTSGLGTGKLANIFFTVYFRQKSVFFSFLQCVYGECDANEEGEYLLCGTGGVVHQLGGVGQGVHHHVQRVPQPHAALGHVTIEGPACAMTFFSGSSVAWTMHPLDDIKGLDHQMDMAFVDMSGYVDLGLNKGRSWLFNFLGAPLNCH